MKINDAVASSSARKSRQGDELQAILGYLLDFEAYEGSFVGGPEQPPSRQTARSLLMFGGSRR